MALERGNDVFCQKPNILPGVDDLRKLGTDPQPANHISEVVFVAVPDVENGLKPQEAGKGIEVV
jgi:hypothetical protein